MFNKNDRPPTKHIMLYTGVENHNSRCMGSNNYFMWDVGKSSANRS